MASNLTKTTKSVKKFLLYFAIFVIIIILADYLIKSTDKLNPPVEENNDSEYYPQIDTIFQNIPSPQIKNLPLANVGAKISKDQIKFPEFPPVVNIYKLKPEQENFYEANQAREIATLLKLTSAETKTINNVMYWETLDKNRTMSFDKSQRLWNYRINTQDLGNIKITSSEDLISQGIEFLNEMGLNNNYIFQSNVSNAYLTYLDDQDNYFSNSQNKPNSARLILNKEIELIKPITDEFPTLKAPIKRINYIDGIANMTLINNAKDIYKDMMLFNYKAHDYESSFGIYPIISISKAYDMIQNNQGYLYRLSENGSNLFEEATIKTIEEFKITLGNTKIIYIESININSQEPWTKFLQPFYLFEGQTKSSDNKTYSFSFIVPALDQSNYISL